MALTYSRMALRPVVTWNQLVRCRYYHSSSVYVHWPYCSKLCTYCNFNKYLNDSSRGTEDAMKECLLKELETMIQLTQTTTIHSVYFGGGTPSLAHPETIEGIIRRISDLCDLSAHTEVTLESNPSEWSKYRDFKMAGVNRISLGLQSLRDQDLVFFNRNHTREVGLRALEVAKKEFPGRTNVDVLFGRPRQSLLSWISELNEVIDVCDDHVSLYQLTVERGTPLARSVLDGSVVLPSADTMADMYITAVEVLESKGILRYEVSNFASPGAENKHNLAYWQGGKYIGIGPGAHSRLSLASDRSETHAVVQRPEPKEWMKQVTVRGHGIAKTEILTREQRLEEVVLTMLRTKQGITNDILDRIFPGTTAVCLFSQSESVLELLQTDLLEVDERGLRATSKGLNVVDSITCDVIDHLKTKYGSSTTRASTDLGYFSPQTV